MSRFRRDIEALDRDRAVLGKIEGRATGSVDDVFHALQLGSKEVIRGKGGFWIRGEGFIALAQARRRTGIKAPKRSVPDIVRPWGDYATIAMLNRPRRLS